MTDIKSPEQRSRNMAAVKSRDTKPEMLVRRFLHAAGFRYTLNNKKYPGSPDIVLPRLHVAIFVNGCFWHRHENCKYFHLPKSNFEFWENKIDKNIKRDARVKAELENSGWQVIVIWECELKTKEKRESSLQTLYNRLADLRKDKSNLHPYSIGDEEGADSLIAAEPDADLKIKNC